MKSEMLSRLTEYLNNTSIEQLKQDWMEIEQLKLEGPHVYEYIGYMKHFYSSTSYYCSFKEFEIPKNMIPSYSGSSFFSNIAI